MKCSEFKNAIWDYAEGKRSEEMERHYLSCAECRREADHCCALLNCVGKLGGDEFPKDLHERIMQRIRQEGPPQNIQPSKRRYVRIATGIAAALVITFVGVLAARSGFIGGNSTNSAEQPQYAMADARTPDEISKEAALGDAGATAEDGSMLETDAPDATAMAPTMGTLASGGAASNVLNAPLTDRERVEDYLTTNAIPFDETDSEIYAYAYGETFAKLESFLINELGMDKPENTDEQCRTTIVFE